MATPPLTTNPNHLKPTQPNLNSIETQPHKKPQHKVTTHHKTHQPMTMIHPESQRCTREGQRTKRKREAENEDIDNEKRKAKSESEK